MHILISELPHSDWWGKGMPQYKNNWLMAQKNIPRPEIVRDAHARLVRALTDVVPLTIIPFPSEFDTPEKYIHDFVFVRDSFIFIGNRTIVISNYSERGRQEEAIFMRQYLGSHDFRILRLSEDAHAEGGEFSILHYERIMFAGLNRNNMDGVTQVARHAGIENVCIVKTRAFHLDTNFTVLLDGNGRCAAVLAVLDAIENASEVVQFCRNHHIPLIEIDVVDGMGDPENPGSLAANSLGIPGVLVGCAHFTTPGVEEKISALGINHIVVPLYDLKFTGGSVHCLTNELAV